MRKLVHVGGVLFVPLAFFNQYLALAAALLAVLVFVVFERQKRREMSGLFRLLYREGEYAAVAFEPLAYLLAIVALLALSVVFMPSACYAAIVVMTVGDGIASLIGRSVGGPALPHSHKTWAGSLAGFVAAAVAGYLAAGPVAVAGAAGGMAAEAYAGRYDNAITAAAAFACAVVVALLLPGTVR